MGASWPPSLHTAFKAAESWSRDLHHGYIGTEHLLLGLLASEGTRAADRLEASAATLERARDLVLAVVPGGTEDLDDRTLPITPDAAAACKRVLKEAERAGPAAIGSEHVLRAILRRRSLAHHVVRDLGLDPDALADQLRRPQPDVTPPDA